MIRTPLCTDASHLLLVATTFKCQDGISCMGILTMHMMCVPCDSHSSLSTSLSLSVRHHIIYVFDVVVGWVPCDSHSSLCTDASRLLLVATTFKSQDGIRTLHHRNKFFGHQPHRGPFCSCLMLSSLYNGTACLLL